MIRAVQELSASLGVAASCDVMGVPRASFYRATAAPVTHPTVPPPVGRELVSPDSANHSHPTAAQASVGAGLAPAGPQTLPTAAQASVDPEPAPAGPATHQAPAAPILAGAEPAPAGPVTDPTTRALTEIERQAILNVLHSERFIDRSPAEVFYALLDEGTYLGSIRTYYRVLAENQEVKERRAQRRHPDYRKPELIATEPNQVWTWDITKLLGPVKWTYYYLYVMLDIFSRSVVGWMLAQREIARLAEQFIEETCDKHGIQPGQLTIHSDNGPAMQAKPVVALHAKLDVLKSNSRPHVSNDNPFSESHFKTLKYSPGFPKRFEGFEDARAFCVGFFPWYNQEHRHSGIAFLTPDQVHKGLTDEVLAQRHMRRLEAYQAHPERFIKGPPKPVRLERAVYINRPKGEANDSATATLN